jgi:KUP system potassium uptake protein
VLEYAERLPAARRLTKPRIRQARTDDVTYFVSRMTIARADAPGMPRWRKRLFVALAKTAADPTEYFRLPIAQTVTMGSHVSV